MLYIHTIYLVGHNWIVVMNPHQSSGLLMSTLSCVCVGRPVHDYPLLIKIQKEGGVENEGDRRLQVAD